MPKFFNIIILVILFSSQSFALQANETIHHDILAQITPHKHEIKIVDVVTFDSILNNQITFILHDGNLPKIIGKDSRIEKLSSSDFKKIFPAFRQNKTQHNIPVAGYRVFIPKGKNQFTLEYTLTINHAIETGGAESERSISESPGLILAKGVYLAGESLWYPKFDNELVTFRLTVRLPSQWKSVSQGNRLYVESEATYHLDTWQEKKPQDDIYLIAAKFTEYSQAAGGVKAMAFLRDPDEALAKKYLDVTAQYLAMYQTLLGPYPYTKFALVENFWETGFGMPSFTLLGPQIIRFPFILHSSYPHELLHNWWGNSVYVDYSQGNWAEGLTAYLADHLIKEQKGRGVMHRRSVLQKYTNFTQSGGDFALVDFVSRYDAVTEAVGYGKTLMFFHMLRKKIGDDIFSLGLKSFYMQYRYKVASFADIESVFSQVSNTDLSHFFDTWVSNVGAPDLALENVKVEKMVNGEYELTAELIQRQQKNIIYSLDVPVAISLLGDKYAKLTVVKMQSKKTLIRQVFDAQPIAIEIDPQFDLFRRLDLNETPPSLSQAFGADKGVIILPTNENKKLSQAYKQMAQSWQASQPQNITIAFDNEIQQLPNDKVVWLLGAKNKFKSVLENSLAHYPFLKEPLVESISISNEVLSFKQNSIVLVGRNPKAEKYALVFISASEADAVPGLARKLPHYGKYSYLGFKGVAPTNMLKGQWPIIDSPLTAILQAGKQPLKLKPVKPLVELTPVFSQNKIMNHVRVLADEKMKGRGLGTKELDKAATYIASVFQAIGLAELPQAEGYFQRWAQDINGLGKNINLKNVVGILPGTNPKYADESVIVSAHYDHFGLGEGARAENKGKIHYGADDNASGVAIMLEFARLMVKKGGAERTIIFIAFTGEEANKLGSKYYVQHTKQFPLNKIMGVVNLDAVGRLGEKPLSVFNTQTATEWVHIFRGVGFVTGVNIKSIPKNLGASDDASFVEAKVPAVHFFSGVNADFHRPTDTVEKIDAKGMVKIAIVLKETVDHLASREYALTSTLRDDAGQQKHKRNKNAGQRRVSLGTVPDFAFEGKGVSVTDVVAGSAAEKAGIKKGDVIVKINGTSIQGLREFSQFLRKLNAGDNIKITLKRVNQTIVVNAAVTAR